MSYLNVLSLTTVKTYLRIDDTQNQTDAEITSMINSALSYIEKRTNIIVFPRDKTYIADDGIVKIYDHPINAVISNYDYTIQRKNLYANYCFTDTSIDEVVFNVGYVDPNDVDPELKSAALDIISAMYYQGDSNKSFQEMLNSTTNMFINSNRRFIL